MRGKGDAAGIGDEMGLTEADRPHRMLFVGDHPLYDEPRDARVLFHLEPCALTRSALDLAALLVRLRDLGHGSLARGFETVGRGPWWRFWRRRLPPDRPVRCPLPGLDPVMLMARRRDCPVIAFAGPPEPPAPAEEVSFVPVEVAGKGP